MTSTLAAQHGLTEEAINQKAIAASNLVVKMMQDPEVQRAVANVDAAAVGMGANVVNKLEPIVLKTMMKTGNQLSTAGIQTVEGVADAIPGVDDVEGLMQLIYAGTKMVAAGMTTAASAVDAGTAVIGTVGSKGAELASNFDAAIDAASNAIPKVPAALPKASAALPKVPTALPKASAAQRGGKRSRKGKRRRERRKTRRHRSRSARPRRRVET